MPAMAGTILRREHLVAACLVGTVVVVVGFASGLGLTKPAATGAQATQNATMPPMSQGTQPAGPATDGGAGGGGGSGPVNYVGTPIGLAAAPPGVLVTGVPTTSDAPPTTSETAPPPTTTTMPPPTGTPPATCEAGVLNALLSQADTLLNPLPVVGPLTPQLTNALVGNCSGQSTVDGPTPSATQAAVPGLLPLLGPTGTGS
ncbi:MAG TPA: hypothetical protein VGM75_20215 [Pseudonocardiaceae bacterium]